MFKNSPPFKFDRSYVHQFPNSGLKSTEFVDSENFGCVSFTPFKIVATMPVYFRNKTENLFAGTDHIEIRNIEKFFRFKNDLEVQITRLLPNGYRNTSFLYQKNRFVRELVTATDENPKTSCIVIRSRVNGIELDILPGNKGFWLIVGLDNYMKIRDKDGVIRDEIFSISCLEIQAEQMNFNKASFFNVIQ